MRFDTDSQSFVVDDDFALPAKFFIRESYPVPAYSTHPAVSHETRVMRCIFENRWGLSIIWGSMTYGDNHDHPYGGFDYTLRKRMDPAPFVEQPSTVELGIIMPEPITRPEVKIDMPGWKGPESIPEHVIELWGDPLGYVDAEQVKFVARIVSRLDSHQWAQIDGYGPYVQRDSVSGELALVIEQRDDGPDIILTLVSDELRVR